MTAVTTRALPRTTQRPLLVEKRRTFNLTGLLTVVSVLVMWQIAAVVGLLPPTSVPRPTAVVSALGTAALSAGFWAAVWATVSAALLGLLLIVVIALPMALLIGRFEFFRLSTWVPIEFLKPIPPVALIPLGLLMVGPTSELKIALIVFAGVWPLTTQLVYGLREVDGVANDMSRTYRLGPWLHFSRITLPSILPFAITGLRISAAIALVVAVVVELIAGVPGLGQSIGLAQLSGLIPEMYAGIVAAGLLGLAFNGCFTLMARKALFWHPSIRSKR